MPIYEFQCHHCGGRIEELMRLSDPDPLDCPSCNKPGLKRMLSAPSFRLAGSGWYETDFKKDGKRNLAGDGGSDSGTSAGGDSSAPAKTEAKPEAKTEGAKPAATAASEVKKTGSAPPAAS